MAIELKDIPNEPLTPEEVELLANDEFDYADRHKVSMREANRKIVEQFRDRRRRQNLAEVNKVFGTNHDISDPHFNFGTLKPGPGDFTFKEKVSEVAKAAHRGLGSIVKLPGIALKAIGETPLTRAEIEKMRRSSSVIDVGRAVRADSLMAKRTRKAADMLRRAGNRYIEIVDGMMTDASRETQTAQQQPFMSAPFFRTAVAVGESAPSYGLAIAATLTSGNPNLGLYILGTTTAASSYESLREQGVDPDLALIGAVVEGSIEMLTEKVPMDILMKGGGRPFLSRALRLGTAESFQELFAQLGQNYTEAVIKDIDPENLASARHAARQEWSVITAGWEDAMAAGFVMGGGASAFSPAPDFGRTADEMRAEYGFVPRNVNEILSLVDQVKQKVNTVQPFEGVLEAAAKAGDTVDVTLQRLQAEVDAKAKIAGNIPLESAEREQFPELAKQEDQIAKLRAGELRFIQEATPEAIAAQAIPPVAEPEVVVEEKAASLPIPIEEARVPEIGKGEIKPRGTSVSVMAQAIENEMVEDHKTLFDELPSYRAMNMQEQSRKALELIETDIDRARRIALYKEAAPPDLFPENVFTALRVYAKMNTDVDLLMDLALNEDAVREHTIMGKRIKSLDTDQDYADPVRAIREVVETRRDNLVRKGKDTSALELKLRDLQLELDTTRKAYDAFTKKARKIYGTKNKLVTRVEYDKIIARRRKESAKLRHDPRLGAVFVPTVQDFTDIAKVGLFHLEAMGRDFAKWSHQMTMDFGDWIVPRLQGEYDKALKEAKSQGVEIKESKRLTAKKKRLATTTKKLDAKLGELDLAKTARIPIELDEEGRQLQREYDTAREKYKAAQAVANIITEEEVRIIAQLAKDTAERRAVMENSKRRDNSIGEGATKTELEYGIALSMFLEYVGDLKVEANKRTFREVLKSYLTNPVDFISDFAGTLKAAKASLDNSFHLRQGLPTFLKGITGDVQSLKIWWKTFIRSWKTMWNTLRKRKVMRGLFAEMVSDPDYELLKTSGVALNVIEEEIPVDIPSRIPVLGILFRMGENAFVGSSRYMRYQLAKQYINIWRKSGKQLNKRELQSIGLLANSQTGRGEIANRSQRPGLLNNVFWSPRNLRAHIDILTVHMFNRNFSAFARKQAAINLLRYISGAAMILALAKWMDDDSVTDDPRSADFGKIKIGDTRFSVGGGLTVLVVLASRLWTREITSSITGRTKSLDTGRFGAIGGKDLIFNFVTNKLSPAAALTLSIIDQKTWIGDQLTVPQMVDDALTPLLIQSIFEAGNADDSANVLAVLMAEALGVNVQTYRDRKKQKPKTKSVI